MYQRPMMTATLGKTHWLDAACVGKSTPDVLKIKCMVPLSITAYEHGCRQMCLMDKYGFPRTKAKEKMFKHGFKTGDIVQAIVPRHLKNAGTHVGRMSAKAKGSFTLATKSGTVPDVGKNYCRKLHRSDGYGYAVCGQPFFPFARSRRTHPALADGSPERDVMVIFFQ